MSENTAESENADNLDPEAVNQEGDSQTQQTDEAKEASRKHFELRQQKRQEREAEKARERERQALEDKQKELEERLQATPTEKPSRDDFIHADDPDSAFDNALETFYKSEAEKTAEQLAAKRAEEHESGQRLIEQQKMVSAALTTYQQSADELGIKNLKENEEALRDICGDNFVDSISVHYPEKAAMLFANLAQPENANKAIDLAESLQTGEISATIRLGEMIGQLSHTPNTSSAPPPETEIQGNSAEAGLGSWKERFDRAVNKGGQSYLDFRMEADAAGVDLSTLM